MRRLGVLLTIWAAFAIPQPPLLAQSSPESEAEAEPRPEVQAPEPAAAEPTVNGAEGDARLRQDLNLAGRTNVRTGESRRNENIQFNLIDNNAVRELNQRLGTTATIVGEFQPGHGYFGSEFGSRPYSPGHLGPFSASRIHGSLFANHLNSVFSARSFFQVGPVRPARENHYGADLSLPVWRSGALSLEGSQNRQRGNVNGNVLVPRPDERTPLTNDPILRPMVEGFLRSYPAELPNRTDINPRALNTNAPQSIDTDAAAARLNQQIGARDRLVLDYRYTEQQVQAFQLTAGQNPDTTIRGHAPKLTWTRTWSPNTVTDFSAGLDRVTSLLVPERNALPVDISVGQVISDLGPSSSIPIDRAQNRIRSAGRIRQIRGAHAWQTGFDIVRTQFNGIESSSHRPSVQFRNDFGRDAITNLRMAAPTRYSTALGESHIGFRNAQMLFHADDTWRVHRRLTLSAGVRYQPVTAPYEVARRIDVPYPCDCNNMGGNFGLAAQLPGGLGVVRAAYGLFYAEILPATYQQVRFNPPQVFKLVVTDGPDLRDPLGRIDLTQLDRNSRATYFELDPRLVTPYSHHYNFSWEPSLGSTWKLQLGYVGSRSHKLVMKWYTNRAQPVEGIPLTTATVNDRRPDQRYFDVRRIFNANRSYFDAARVTLLAPRWHRFSINASYWFSHAIDTGSDYTSTGAGSSSENVQTQTGFLIHRDVKGPSAFDQTHAFLWNAAYETPPLPGRAGWLRGLLGQWTLSTVTLVKTGTPFTVESGSDAPGFGNADGINGDRPHILDPSILGRTIGRPETAPRLLPASAFAFIRVEEQLGSLGRNTFRKAGIGNVNAALARTWRFGSEKSVTFRAESINFFNTPQFAAPGFTLSAGDFGQITNTLNDGRTFRFSLRLGF